MRPYRGKRIDNGEWVYGWYAQQCVDAGEFRDIIIEQDGLFPFEVDPTTVSQQIGKQDINKKEIYAGDIVKDRTPETRWWDGVVTWHKEGSIGWVVEPLPKDRHRGAWGLNYGYELEIIGNIHSEASG